MFAKRSISMNNPTFSSTCSIIIKAVISVWTDYLQDVPVRALAIPGWAGRRVRPVSRQRPPLYHRKPTWPPPASYFILNLQRVCFDSAFLVLLLCLDRPKVERYAKLQRQREVIPPDGSMLYNIPIYQQVVVFSHFCKISALYPR